jgi:hypothetical protein
LKLCKCIRQFEQGSCLGFWAVTNLNFFGLFNINQVWKSRRFETLMSCVLPRKKAKRSLESFLVPRDFVFIFLISVRINAYIRDWFGFVRSS